MGKVTRTEPEAPAARLERAEILARLAAQGVGRQIAVLYTDAFLEYREASENIAAHGAMVLHPRTANPIENPYLKVRDRAFVKLRKLGYAVNAPWLW